MSKVKIVLNRSGVREMLLSNEMEDICLDLANNVKSKVGDGYEVNTYKGKNRVNASIYAKTIEAKKDNSENNTLIKAVSG